MMASEEAARRLKNLDAGTVRASIRKYIRRRVVLLVLCVAFVSHLGIPHIRINYVEQRGRIQSAEYWGVTGWRSIRAGEVAPTCPLIALVPFDRSMISNY